MNTLPLIALVVAKAPEPGKAKTRLAKTVGERVAAEIAAAALLDTLDAVADMPVAGRVVALTGDVDAACAGVEIRRRLGAFAVIGQRGDDFADRLANAHVDAGEVCAGLPVLQIGMDTPQVTTELLTECAGRLLSVPAVLGPACDGGWWILGLRDPAAAECLRGVPMSRPDTGELTAQALRANGIDVVAVKTLPDVDVIEDIAGVRDACAPSSRFAQVTRAAAL